MKGGGSLHKVLQFTMDNLGAAVKDLDQVCIRLNQLCFGASSTTDVTLVAGAFEQANTFEDVIAKLAETPAGRALITRVADEINDEAGTGDDDNGYPPIVNSESDSEIDESGTSESGTSESGTSESDTSESDTFEVDESGTPESDTDAEDKLDDVLETVLDECVCDHAQNKLIRELIGEGKTDREALREAGEDSDYCQQEIADRAAEDAEDGEYEEIEHKEAAIAEIAELHNMVEELAEDLDRDRPALDNFTSDQLLVKLEDLEADLDSRVAAYDVGNSLLRKRSQLANTYCALRGNKPPQLEKYSALADEIVENDTQNEESFYVWSIEDADHDERAEILQKTSDNIRTLQEGINLITNHQPGRKRKRDELEALDEIREEQLKTDLIIDPDRFSDLVSEMTQEFSNCVEFSPDALEALQESAESYLVDLFARSNKAAIHARRTIVFPKDMQFVQSMER